MRSIEEKLTRVNAGTVSSEVFFGRGCGFKGDYRAGMIKYHRGVVYQNNCLLMLNTTMLKLSGTQLN